MLNSIRLFLLASWLGAAIFFSGVVAPNVFRVLRAFNLANANEIAGTIVSRTLSVVNISGFILSLILLVTVFAFMKSYPQWSFVFQIVLLIIVAVTTGFGEWVIAARMRALRSAMPLGIDRVAAGDAMRLAFDALHGYSVAALAIAVIAALITYSVMFSRLR